MNVKKNPKLNFEKKRILFFHVGLLTITAATLAAFTYEAPLESEREKNRIVATQIDYVVEEQEIEPEKELVYETPRKDNTKTDNVNLDIDNIDLNTDLLLIDNDDKKKKINTTIGLPDLGNVDGIGVGKVDKGDAFPFPDVEAKFIGGYGKMQEYIGKEFNFPQIDKELGNQGRVYVRFIVETNGEISNVKVIKGISKTLDREAKRIVEGFPSWTPGEVKGEVVRTVVELPIVVTLQ